MHAKNRWTVGLVLFASVATAYGLAAVLADDKPDRGKGGRKQGGGIEHLMERTHEGRNSPLGQTKGQLGAAAPDWNVILQQVEAFQVMSKALTEARKAEIKDAADGYADAVKDLAAAAKKRDRAAAQAALKALTNSCTDCHYKGGPGGRLEDD